MNAVGMISRSLAVLCLASSSCIFAADGPPAPSVNNTVNNVANNTQPNAETCMSLDACTPDTCGTTILDDCRREVTCPDCGCDPATVCDENTCGSVDAPGCGTVECGTCDDGLACTVVGDLSSCCMPLEAICDANPGLEDGAFDAGDGCGERAVACPGPPTPVPPKFKQMAAGEAHTCALAQNGKDIFCWGSHEYGILGEFPDADEGPRTVPALAHRLSDVRTIASGARHVCVLTTPAGAPPTVRCWGST